MNKQTGYRIFAVIYKICCLFPVDDHQVFFVMTHDASAEGNVGVVENYMKGLQEGYHFTRLIRTDTYFSYVDDAPDKPCPKMKRIGNAVRKAVRFFLYDAYKMARSRYIFLDNMFLPMAYMKFRKKVRVVQLWHGTGTLKKLGQDVNEGELRDLEYRANQVTTDLIVSADEIAGIYAKSFAMSPDKVKITGMPRTDILFDKNRQKECLEEFYRQYPVCRDKKMILYAPTFRDEQKEHPKLELDAEYLSEKLGEGYVIGLRMHPFVARNIKITGAERILDFSSYKSLNTLLFATDILITDYSSILFEYAVLDRPMLFYAYDLDTFVGDGRGFYKDYTDCVPGAVVRTMEELAGELAGEDTYGEKRRAFVKAAYRYKDGKSMERLAELLGIGK